MMRFDLHTCWLACLADCRRCRRAADGEGALPRVPGAPRARPSRGAVDAERTYEGVDYGFCSEKCAKEFDADPAAYRRAGVPAPGARVLDADRPRGEAGVARRRSKGKVVLLDFWATWCAPCRKSMPELQALHAKYGPRGLVVVGVSIDEDGPARR